MLYSLGDPLSFVVLVASFLFAVTLAGWVQSLLAARSGVRPEDPRRLRPDPRAHVDPFGAVAAALTGLGWTRPVPLPRRRPDPVALAAPALLLGVGAGLLVGFGLLEGQVRAGTDVLQSGAGGVPLLPRALALAGLVHLYVGLLSLVPLPPLDGGRLLFARAPRTPGWQRAELYLVEKNLGTLAVVVLLLLPLAGQRPLLLEVLSRVGTPLVGLLTGLVPA